MSRIPTNSTLVASATIPIWEQSGMSACWPTEMEVGVDSFAAALDDTGVVGTPTDRMRDLLEQIERADQVGLDVFGVGRAGRVPEAGAGSLADLAGCGRDARFVRSRGRARTSVDGRDHRRRDAAVPTARRPLLGGRQASRVLARSTEGRRALSGL